MSPREESILDLLEQHAEMFEDESSTSLSSSESSSSNGGGGSSNGGSPHSGTAPSQQPSSLSAPLSASTPAPSGADGSAAAPTTSFVRGKKRVSFGEIRIREHKRTVGDHPEARSGPPVSLDWESVDLPSRSLREYERDSFARRSKRPGGLSGSCSLRMTGPSRRRMLLEEFDAEPTDLLEAEREAEKVQRQREETRRGGKVAFSMVRAARALKSAKKVFGSNGSSSSSSSAERRQQQIRNERRENMFMGFAAAATGGMMPLSATV